MTSQMVSAPHSEASFVDNEATHTGIAMGTIVLTLDGEIPVEHLTAGDRVITRDSGMAILKSAQMREQSMRPYKISAERLGNGQPTADTYVAAGQQILVRGPLARALFKTDQSVVAVSRLADGEYITRCEEQVLRYFTLEFDTSHIIYANGLEVTCNARQLAVAA